MTALLAPLPVLDPVEVDEPDDVVHRVCCDDDIALCAESVDGEDWVDEDEDVRDCPLCALVWEEGGPCPVPGCPYAVRGLRRFWRRLRGRR